jgi:uncharacterized protein (TIGR02117 family)
MRHAATAARWLAAGVGLMLLGLLLGALPSRNIGFRQADGPDAIAIRVAASLAHTELILPVAAAGHDWRPLLPADAIGDGRPLGRHISISWGDADFFLGTPTWAELDWRLGLRALFASRRSLVHVYRLDIPPDRWAPDAVTIRLTPAQYRALAAGIEAELARPLAPVPGYGADDGFFAGTRRYHALHSCNQWAANRLAEAGVSVGRWTPVAPSLMTPLRWQFGTEE